MGKLYITQELKDANDEKLDAYEVGQEVEYTLDCSEITAPCKGHWVNIGGICVCQPTP